MTMSSLICEDVCRDIHDSWGELNTLATARATASQTQLECPKIMETHVEEVFVSPYERDAVLAREALHDHINYKALLEIFVCRKSSHVLLIQQAYQNKFRRQLEQDIFTTEPPHKYQRILIALGASHKAHHADVSEHIAKCDARRLYQTGEGKTGAIDEAVVVEILTKRSIPQLNLTFSTYNHIYGHTYTKSLKNENYGEFEDALKTVVKLISKPSKYYAKLLYESLKGVTMDKGALTRVMVGRSEIDMDEIQKVFRKKYGMELRDAICESLPSGDYKDFLLGFTHKTPTTPRK